MIRISAEVRDALANGGAVVALETTLVAHGFPPGEGVAVGLESEAQVRAAGAVPATVGVLDGEVRVGLTEDELARFDVSARKAGPRDLGAATAQRAIAATTVGGTLAVARIAGIRFMATGGIGGVHRGFPHPPDVSADLGELARTPALVVSAGVKSLLDVPATAELLETLGVPVLGFRVDTLPLFYGAAGGPPVSARVESAEEAARVAAAHWELGGSRAARRPPSRRAARGRRAADRESARRCRVGRSLRSGGHAVRPLVPAPRKRRPHTGREPRVDRAECAPRRRDRGRQYAPLMSRGYMEDPRRRRPSGASTSSGAG